jgi:hypothetical protein
MKRPGQVRFNVTPAIRRALKAANNQQVSRTYGPNGNTLKSEGISSRVLWVCVANHLIEDEPGTASGSTSITCRMRLTKAGLIILGASNARQPHSRRRPHTGNVPG